MDKFNLYDDIAKRTKGDIYLGVVGPVRTGKSTFVRRFVQELILPKIEDKHEKQRVIDELPQSGAGKMVMTVQPKFVPNQAVEINLDSGANAKVRLIDCVGYIVDGALGAEEEGTPRMVKTPWSQEDMPFSVAAEIGTEKVIKEHSTIAVIVTSDGTITDIDRSSYLKAEERVVSELKEAKKPFVIVLNSLNPYSEDAKKRESELRDKYLAPVVLCDVSKLSIDDINQIITNSFINLIAIQPFPIIRIIPYHHINIQLT